MSQYDRNKGKPWKGAEVNKVKQLAKGNTPTRVIALKLGRTPAAIYKVASQNNIPLKPSNQSPYNRRSK